MNRYLSQPITADLKSKMVFIGGPRQVGKTTLAVGLLKDGSRKHPAYLNWDVTEDRKRIMDGQLPLEQPLIVLDEIHKYARWRGLVKGLYDRHYPDTNLVVTGSARLDYYSKGGDSLQGRYHYYRLHPLSLCELAGRPTAQHVHALLRYSGFPEPFLKQDETALRRWRLERSRRIVQEDLRDLERVRELSLIELLLDALPSRVGAPLSVKSLREDLQVTHETTERWISMLERLYVCYRIPPFGSPKIRAVKKEQKLYFWDWTQVEEAGPRFENLVASQLLKYCHFREDTEGYRMELRFIRDTDGREIDFVVLQEKKPLFAVECKSGEKQPSPHLAYFRQRTSIPRFYQVHLGSGDSGSAEKSSRVLPFHVFCQELGMP